MSAGLRPELLLNLKAGMVLGQTIADLPHPFLDNSVVAH